MDTSAHQPDGIVDPDLRICDCHHHVWRYPTSTYLLPDLLRDLTDGHRIESTVFVECGSFYEADRTDGLEFAGETRTIGDEAATYVRGAPGPIRPCEGVVGRADLTFTNVGELLDAHQQVPGFRGIRHCGAWDPSPAIRPVHSGAPADLYASSAFRAGFAELARRDLTFDAWQYHTQLGEVADLADAFPNARIVLNHCGGPLGIGPYADQRQEVFHQWAGAVRDVARRDNVWVKLGGLGMTLAGFGFKAWDPPPAGADLAEAWRPYIHSCIEAFGVGRAMFESNYPMDGVSGTYRTIWNGLKLCAAGAGASEKERLFWTNARTFYRLDNLT